jgi:S1-C subfamily serine protease
MRPKQWFISGAAFVAGVIACLIAVFLLSPNSWRSTTLSGPVAIAPPGAADRGYLGAVFSNEPSRSLYIADVSRPAANDSDPLNVGDRLTSINGRTITTLGQFQEIIKARKPGEIVELGVLRNDQPKTLRIRLLSLSDILASRNGSPSAP